MRKIILSVLFILLFNSFAIANIINIPADQPTIQAGINSSIDGDTILVQPDIYYENINFNGKNIIIGSLFLTTQDTIFISQTVIDGNQNGSVVTFENGENAESVLFGFTLINGNGNTIFGSRSGGGIFCNNSNPSLLNLIITNNSTESDGGGIFCCINSSPNIENVVISFNSTEEYGGGLCCYDGSNPSLVNVTISDNLAHWGGGGISCFSFCNPSLANITISGNEAYYWAGGGIYCDFYCSPSFENVTVSYNKAVAGGGINFYYGCTPVFDSDNRCNIYSNFADYANDLFIDYCQIINVIVDTFTVLNPTNFHAHPVENCTFDILNGRLQQVDSDLYVAPDGSNSNSGLSFDYPLKTIRYAYSIIDVNSSNYHSIYLAPGIYSQDTADEYFPVGCINFVSLEGSGEDETILDAGGMKKVLCFNRANEATVKGISVKNGYSACGGGISFYKSSPNLLDMKILNNTANDGGGIFCYANCNPILENVTIIGNTANADGGAIHFWNNCHLTLINVTISNNSANRGGGIYNFYNSNMIIVNSILWNDLPDEIQGSANAFYSDIQGGWTGEGNINIDPFFVDPENGDFHLQDNSTCIDAGTAYFEWQGNVIIDLSPDEYIGIAPDMGAYEFGMQGIIDDKHEPIKKMGIKNYPNPFNPRFNRGSTTISFSIPKDARNSEIKIYNIKGQLVKQFSINYNQSSIIWDGRDENGKQLTNGIYLYKLSADRKSITKKMLLMR